MQNKKILVLGAGGFIGFHLVKKLKKEGAWVRGVDLKLPSYETTDADDFLIGDLCDKGTVDRALDQRFDEVYQLAADMGGAGYIFSGQNDARVMYNSAQINLNVAEGCRTRNIKTLFYSSSACIYPEHNQLDPNNPNCEELSAYPANPDSEYGWEKLFSERIYLAYNRNHLMNYKIARFHNIFGPLGAWGNGKEKSPAAICRKIAEAKSGDTIEVWGDGKQTRSFLFVDECLEGLLKLTRSQLTGPYNIGSDQMLSINDLVALVAQIAGKKIHIDHIPGPLGVRGRNSDNNKIYAELGWKPTRSLKEGLEKTYAWINEQVLIGKPDIK
jgi:GDP-D-mannose 3',5'-epimerase